jgi:uncharacterized membrane protein YeaQ/YmgE (transglycosylase-associated protein family)
VQGLHALKRLAVVAGKGRTAATVTSGSVLLTLPVLTSGSPLAPCDLADDRMKEHVMSIVAWILLGLVAGFIASKIVNHSGEGVLIDIVLGVVGAVVGGFAFSLVGTSGVSGLNIWSLFVATMGAIMVLVIKHAVTDRRLAH